MKHEEKIKLENYKEHYNSIMRSISIANTEIGETIKKRDKVKQELEDLEEIVKDNIILAEIFSKEQKEKRRSLAKEEQRLVKKLEDIAQFEKDSLENISYEREVLRDEEDEYRITLRVISEDLKIIRQEEKERLDNCAVIGESIKVREVLKEKLERILKDLQEKRTTESDEQIILSKQRLKEKKVFQDEIKELQEQIEKEKERIITSHESLAERERVVTRRERDAQVLVNRLKLVYKRITPDRIIKI